MIITITGKPCSGKGTISKIFCNNYNFDYISIGNLQREYAEKNGQDIISYNANVEDIKKSDKIVDDKLVEIGKTRLNDDLIVEARLGWLFIPKSFKVFIDVDWDVAGERLLNAKRENEQVNSVRDARNLLIERWNNENARYRELYNQDNLDNSHYDLVISSTNLTPEEISLTIYNEYLKFLKIKNLIK